MGVIVALTALGAAAINIATKQGALLDSEYIVTITQEEERERSDATLAVVLSHPEVKKIIDSSISYAPHYHMLDNNIDLWTIITREYRTVEPLEGNFTNGYKETLSGQKIIEAEVDRISNAVLSINIESTSETVWNSNTAQSAKIHEHGYMIDAKANPMDSNWKPHRYCFEYVGISANSVTFGSSNKDATVHDKRRDDQITCNAISIH